MLETTLTKGTMVKINGIPFELLEDTRVFGNLELAKGLQNDNSKSTSFCDCNGGVDCGCGCTN